MTNKKELYGVLAALFANIIFGFSFIFSKMALTVAHPLIILSLRFTLAFIFLNILWLSGCFKITLKGKPKFKLILMAIAQPLLYFIFELYGLSMVSSALSGVIISLVPVVVMVLAGLFLKEKATKLQIGGTLISIIAISAISITSNDGSKNHFLGIILLIGAVICAAVFNILSRSQSATFSPFERTYMMFSVGLIGFNLLSIFTLGNDYIPELLNAVTDIKFIIAILYLALLSSVAAFMLYNYSTTLISAVQSSSFSNVITVVTVLAGVFILKEDFSILEMILSALILIGVWAVNYFTKKTCR